MLLPFIFIFLVFLDFTNAGDTTCARIDARWNNADGLNPCEVYQRLRQLCDSEYEVPALSLDGPNRPTDRCSDGSPCCCNSVAFQLSMLCLSCQRGTDGTKAQGTGAVSGSYQSYISSCPPDSDSVTSSVQAQICNSTPRLDVPSYLYRYRQEDTTGGWSEDKLSVDLVSSDASPCSTLHNDNGSSSADEPVETTNTRTWGPVPAQVAYTRTQTPYKTRALIGGLLGGAIALVAIVAAGVAVYMNRREKKRRLQFEASQAPEMAETQPLRSQRHRSRAPRTEVSLFYLHLESKAPNESIFVFLALAAYGIRLFQREWPWNCVRSATSKVSSSTSRTRTASG
ncbi:hypothetical protein EXIGLDRAFT_760910 [Exidia glandulosa HHB12029]|uniref:Uncharacterized protein n=1 Tax=Exidia glandulosa HHB12029 TaxID=1314781 RepID=A0A165NZ17_EXIGL|nr:hypothetical protein EXIGLDRAFT_760910 [Exidia glandulosa HHB12029]